MPLNSGVWMAFMSAEAFRCGRPVQIAVVEKKLHSRRLGPVEAGFGSSGTRSAAPGAGLHLARPPARRSLAGNPLRRKGRAAAVRPL